MAIRKVQISVPGQSILINLPNRVVTGDVTQLPPLPYPLPEGAKPVVADIIYDGVYHEPLLGVELVAPDGTGSGTGGTPATATPPASVGATVNASAGTGTVQATPAAGTAPEAYILGFLGAGAPAPVWSTSATAVFPLAAGLYVPFARSVIGGMLSAATSGAQVALSVPMQVAGVPVVTGYAVEGQTLTAVWPTVTAGSVTAAVWLRNGTPIAGATGQSYTLVQADVGARLSVRATLTPAGGGTAVQSTSAETATVTSGIFVSSSVPRVPAQGISSAYPAGTYTATLLANSGVPAVQVVDQAGTVLATLSAGNLRFTVPAGTTGIAFVWASTAQGYVTMAVAVDAPVDTSAIALSNTSPRAPATGTTPITPGAYTVTPITSAGDVAVQVFDQAGKPIGDFDASGASVLQIPVGTTAVHYEWASASVGDVSFTLTPVSATGEITLVRYPEVSGDFVVGGTVTITPALYSDGSVGDYGAWKVNDLPSPGLEISVGGSYTLVLQPAWEGHYIDWAQFWSISENKGGVGLRRGPVAAAVAGGLTWDSAAVTWDSQSVSFTPT